MTKSNGRSQATIDEARKVFDKFYKNGDGKISCDELEELLRLLGSTTPPDEVKRVMQEFDKNGDSYIDLDELVEFHLGGDGESAELKDTFDLYDGDGNGLISANELHAVLKKLGEKCKISDGKKMIKEVDVDGDGHVNFEEFKNMMTRA